MIDFIVGLVMFIPNLIFSLISGVFNVALYIVKIPFHLVGGLFHLLMSPFVAIFLFFNPGQMDNAVATTVPSSPKLVAQSTSKIEKPKYYSLDDLNSGYDRLMMMKGFQKPYDFTINDDFYYSRNKISGGRSNPISIYDEGEEIVLTKIDLEKSKTYIFKGEAEQALECGFLEMAIMDDSGNILANSEVASQPSFDFKPRNSRQYNLVTRIKSHYQGDGCESKISEYIKEN